jgi:hypothetical protein
MVRHYDIFRVDPPPGQGDLTLPNRDGKDWSHGPPHE